MYLNLDIILVLIKKKKNIHAIRVVFQGQAMHGHTSFWGEKTYKIGKKRYVFSHGHKLWKMMENYKKMAWKKKKTMYLGYFFHGKYVLQVYFEIVLKVYFEIPFMRIIPSLTYMCPLPQIQCMPKLIKHSANYALTSFQLASSADCRIKQRSHHSFFCVT